MDPQQKAYVGRRGLIRSYCAYTAGSRDLAAFTTILLEVRRLLSAQHVSTSRQTSAWQKKKKTLSYKSKWKDS